MSDHNNCNPSKIVIGQILAFSFDRISLRKSNHPIGLIFGITVSINFLIFMERERGRIRLFLDPSGLL